jgi:hypothetical protein
VAAIAEVTMFIVERRTAGVLAALATAAAMAVLGNVWDRVDEGATPSTANSTAAFATSVGPGVRPIALAADEVRRFRAVPACTGRLAADRLCTLRFAQTAMKK